MPSTAPQRIRQQTLRSKGLVVIQLQEDQLYCVGGGFFRAHFNPERDQWELWTHQGLSGSVIGRMGFDVDAGGTLYDRVMDFETGQPVMLVHSGYSVADLEEVGGTGKGLSYFGEKQRGGQSLKLG